MAEPEEPLGLARRRLVEPFGWDIQAFLVFADGSASQHLARRSGRPAASVDRGLALALLSTENSTERTTHACSLGRRSGR